MSKPNEADKAWNFQNSCIVIPKKMKCFQEVDDAICIYLLHISSFPPFFLGRLFVSNAEGARAFRWKIHQIETNIGTCRFGANRVCLVPGSAPTDVTIDWVDKQRLPSGNLT